MQIWAVANQKGGVGKTTSTLALGRALCLRGKRVLLIDLDPHASLTRAFGVDEFPPPKGVMELFADPPQVLRELACDSALPGLQYVCAQPALATLERRSATVPGLGLLLQKALTDPQLTHDYVLMDCAPQLGLLMINALAAADRVVIPTQTEPLALHGLEGMVRTAQMVEKSRKRRLPISILPTLHDKRTRAGIDSLQTMHKRHGELVWEDAIPLDTKLSSTALLTQPASSDAYPGRGLSCYRRALDWMLADEFQASGALP
jgi:chromosome partitioning protein